MNPDDVEIADMADCANCKHWDLANAWAANADGSRFEKYPPPDYELVVPKSDRRWSRCAAAEEGFKDDFDPDLKRMAAWDGSRYMAELITREDFHCCEHEARSIEESGDRSDD